MSTEMSSDYLKVKKKGDWKTIAAATVGTALEWFDLIVYGFFAITIGKLFFPTDNEYVSLIISVASFGSSYLVRPLGAVLIGYYSDRYGRKKALNATIGLMALGTAIIAFTPTYETIGLTAPALILLARLIQGISAGGEFGAATSFLVEKAPPGKKGFYASFQLAAQGGTIVLAGLFGSVLNTALSDEQMLNWGWRVPFIFGLLIVPVAYYIRKHIDELPKPAEKEIKVKTPLGETFSKNKVRLLIGIGVYVLATSSSYVLVMYMSTYAVKQLNIDQQVAFAGAMITGGVQCVACPFFGWLSDRKGRITCLKFAATALMILTFVVFTLLIRYSHTGTYLLTTFIIGLLVSAYQGPMPAFLSEIFPKSVRTTGLALTQNMTVALFGGFAPMILTLGIKETGSLLIPAFYISAAALISLTSLIACGFLLKSNEDGNKY